MWTSVFLRCPGALVAPWGAENRRKNATSRATSTQRTPINPGNNAQRYLIPYRVDRANTRPAGCLAGRAVQHHEANRKEETHEQSYD